MNGFFKGKKTYILAAITALTAVGGYLTGDLSLADAAQMAITAALGTTIRNGMKIETAKVEASK